MDRKKVSVIIYGIAAAVCGFTAARHLTEGKFVGWAWFLVGAVMLGIAIFQLVRITAGKSGDDDEDGKK